MSLPCPSTPTDLQSALLPTTDTERLLLVNTSSPLCSAPSPHRSTRISWSCRSVDLEHITLKCRAVIGHPSSTICALPDLISSCSHPNCLTSSFPQIIDEVAAQYGLAALMQEKPFAVSHSTRTHTTTSASHHLRLADCIALTCSHTLLSSLGGKRIRQAQQLVPLHQRGRQSAKCRTARQEVRQHRDLPGYHGRLSEGCR